MDISLSTPDDAENEETVASYFLQGFDFLSMDYLDTNSLHGKTFQQDDLLTHGFPLLSSDVDLNPGSNSSSANDNCHHTDTLPLPCLRDPVFAFANACLSSPTKGFDLLAYADDNDIEFNSQDNPGVLHEKDDTLCRSSAKEKVSSPVSHLYKCSVLEKIPSPVSQTAKNGGQWTQIKERNTTKSQGLEIGRSSVISTQCMSLMVKRTKRDADEPKRPKNGFIRYSIKFRTELARKFPYKDNRKISKLLGYRWQKMTAEEKLPYEKEFLNDMQAIRDKFPGWRYLPVRRCISSPVEPMPNRLRSGGILKRKHSTKTSILRKTGHHSNCSSPNETKCSDTSHSSAKTPTKNSVDSHSGVISPIQTSALTWVQCDLCNHWRPLPGHIETEDLPEKWYCYMNPDCRFNKCDIYLLHSSVQGYHRNQGHHKIQGHHKTQGLHKVQACPELHPMLSQVHPQSPLLYHYPQRRYVVDMNCLQHASS